MRVDTAYRCEASSDIQRILWEGLKPSKPILSDAYTGMDLPEWAFKKYVFAFPSKPSVIYHEGKEVFIYSRIPDRRFASYIMPEDKNALLSFPIKPEDGVMVMDELMFPDMEGKSKDERVKLAKKYVGGAVPLVMWDGNYLLPSLAFPHAIEPSRIRVEMVIGDAYQNALIV
jgi:hypothetical protein